MGTLSFYRKLFKPTPKGIVTTASIDLPETMLTFSFLSEHTKIRLEKKLIRLNIDTQELKNKPASFDGRLRNRLCNPESIREVTLAQFIGCIKRGRSFTPAVMTGTTRDAWQSQQVICADIDNDTGQKDAKGNKVMLSPFLSPENAVEIMKQYSITPYFMYYTLGHTETWPKFRIVLILDMPIMDAHTASDLASRFTGIFNAAVPHCADTTASDNARIYYGGREDSIIYTSGQTTPLSLLQELPTYENTRQEYKTFSDTNSYSHLQTQFEKDKNNFDLAEYIKATTNSKPVKHGKSLFFNPCPLCGHNDDFQVTGSIYHCHSASGGTGGSIIDYLMNKHNLDVGKACDKFKYEIMGYDREAVQKSNEVEYNSQPPEMAVTTTNASDYLFSGTFERDIEYFQTYKDRKTGMHPDIDKYLTLYPGLAALGGASSLGKTTFAINLTDKFLDKGETVLYFSLEQLPVELITKSLARKLYEVDSCTLLENTDIKNGLTCDELEGIKKEYANKAEKYQIITGSFRTTAADIVSYVEKYIAEHNSCKPIVIIDYLQLIAPPSDFSGSIREYTDENIKTLKDMQKRNGLFVLMISNFNRSSNYEPVSYESFKETSMIEYTCDYIWGLQLALLDAENDNFYTVIGKQGSRVERPIDQKRKLVNEAQAQIPKSVEFVSLKNRNGKQFFKAFFDYDQRHDCYKPTSSKNADKSVVPNAARKI